MNIFIQTVSPTIDFIVYDDRGEVIHTETSEIKGKEFEYFPHILTSLLDTYETEKIFCITGPGSFSKLRIITLTLNACKLIHPKIHLYGISFFEFARGIGAIEPYILPANRSEYLVYKNSAPCFVEKEFLEPDVYFGFVEETDFTRSDIFIQYRYDMSKLLGLFDTLQPVKLLVPLYIKDPHITCTKKILHHS